MLTLCPRFTCTWKVATYQYEAKPCKQSLTHCENQVLSSNSCKPVRGCLIVVSYELACQQIRCKHSVHRKRLC